MSGFFKSGTTLDGGAAGTGINILIPSAGGLLGASNVGGTITPVSISLGSGLSLAGSTLTASGSGGTVTEIDTSGAGISGGPITGTGTLHVEWNAGTVAAIGDGIAISSNNLQSDHQATQTVSGATATVTPAAGTTSSVITLQASTTLTIANGSYAGQHFRLELLQDGTGSRTVAFDSSVEFGTDITSFTASTAPNTRDLVQLFWNVTASKWMFAAVAHGFS